MNKKQIRIDALRTDIRENPSFDIKLLSEKYSVSEMTIRRDIKYLYEEGMLSHLYSHNGSVTHSAHNSYEFDLQMPLFAAEKERIAEYAVSLIKPYDTVLFDTGTTVYRIVERLPSDLPITAICYSFDILPLLKRKENVSIILAGGYFHRKSSSFESEENVILLKRLRAAKMFVSTSGVEKNGLTCYNQYEVNTKRAAIRSSVEKILVTDSGKFGVVKSSYFSSLEEMDLLITDSEIPETWLDYLKEKGPKFHLV